MKDEYHPWLKINQIVFQKKSAAAQRDGNEGTSLVNEWMCNVATCNRKKAVKCTWPEVCIIMTS